MFSYKKHAVLFMYFYFLFFLLEGQKLHSVALIIIQ